MTSRLKVINETAWDTTDLRHFLRVGLASLGARPDKVVTVRYARANCRTLGRASIGTWGEASAITLFVPRPPLPFDVRLYGKVLAHECDHNLGLRHEVMGGCNVGAIDDGRVAWTAGLEVLQSAEPPRPDPVARTEAKAEAARARLHVWERKAKLASTKIKKYRRSVAYYERSMAAAKDGVS